MMTREILELIDGLRDRGVPAIRLKRGDFELVVEGIPPAKRDEVPTDPTIRQKLLRDPNVPDDLKEKIAEQEDEDLYAAS